MQSSTNKFLDTLRDFGMLTPGDTVAVGFSGGADSVCLLSLLNENAGKLGIRLTAVHVNHGIRGAEADADERFAVDFCNRLRVPITVFRADVPSIAAREKRSLELCARETRYAFFNKVKADKIATAHTGSDAAETMLMNLLRGAGLHGLCAIPPVRGNVIRPLIRFTREETERYCAERGLAFVTDSTNTDPSYTRNRVRLNVIPQLRDIAPQFETTAIRCIERLRTEDDYLRRESDMIYEKAYIDGKLNADALFGTHPAILFRVLHRFCAEEAGSDVEERHIRQLAEHIGTSGFSVTLPGGVTVRCCGRYVEAAAAPSTAGSAVQTVTIRKNEVHDCVFVETQLRFTVKDGENHEFDVNFIDFSEIDDIIIIRAAQPGDTIKLTKRNCTKTLKKFYTENKIPASVWRSFPVVADKNGVIWAYLAGADRSRAAKGSTKKTLIINAEGVKNE